MKKLLLVIMGLILFTTIGSTEAAPAETRLRGRILLQVEENGEAWYVQPSDGRRMYMADGNAAYGMMRDLGLGITNTNLTKIPIGFEDRFECLDSDSDGLCNKLEDGLGTDAYNYDTDGDGLSDGQEVRNNQNPLGEEKPIYDNNLASDLSGKILLQVEAHGEAWYINPVDNKRYYMPDGPAAYQIMRYLSLGITNANLDKISIIQDSEILDEYSSYKRYTIDTSRGSFDISLVTLTKDKYLMITDTAISADCDGDCATKSLASYVQDNSAEIGINGTYFCPPDYAECASTKNSFLSPVLNSNLNIVINRDIGFYHNGSWMAAGANGEYFHFHRPNKGLSNIGAWLTYRNTTQIAGISNRPSLIENGVVVVNSEPHYSSYNSKATRGGIGYDDQNIYLVIARSANMIDFAEIFKTLGATEALNLDGGGSSALYYDNSYMIGPGRSLPNAIVFRKKLENIAEEVDDDSNQEDNSDENKPVDLVYVLSHMCETVDDCVPDRICHPTDYINKKYAPDPIDAPCTASCEGPIDCGAGYPLCEKNQCIIGK
ncbi:MAG: phosphodiester glycosidase family protein [Candidatus Komeilibacteria bacterium]|jgi:hypothetical protein|nr:phosphodiester glycosidase family protein [Candidatus Komeilibacteria bacterium]MBT4447681.1 phosphodiester glycosidase family protein [Candidatus Komeilibacteria bacterium]